MDQLSVKGHGAVAWAVRDGDPRVVGISVIVNALIAAWGIRGSEDRDRREATLGGRSAFKLALPW
jgi:hypothetical protein